MIEAKLESQVIGACSASAASGVYWSGAWNAATAGAVKGGESADSSSVVAVTVSPRVMVDYDGGANDCIVDIPVDISAAVRGEMDATGSATLALYTAIFTKVWSWVKAQTATAETDLTVTESSVETFTPGGVRFNGGVSPTWNAQLKTWTFSLSFTVRGVTHD